MRCKNNGYVLRCYYFTHIHSTRCRGTEKCSSQVSIRAYAVSSNGLHRTTYDEYMLTEYPDCHRGSKMSSTCWTVFLEQWCLRGTMFCVRQTTQELQQGKAMSTSYLHAPHLIHDHRAISSGLILIRLRTLLRSLESSGRSELRAKSFYRKSCP